MNNELSVSLINQESYNNTIAKKIIIENACDLDNAAIFLKQIKQMKEMVENSFGSIIEQAHKAHKEAINKRNEYLIPLNAAEKVTKQKINDYTCEQQRLREIELEKERKFVEEQELKRKKEIEDKAFNKILESDIGKSDDILAHAQKEMKLTEDITNGQKEVIENYYLKPTIPENISIRKVFKYKIIDTTKINKEFLMPDEAAIKKIVNTMKKAAEKMVGGIEVYEENSIVSR